jgi:hypothetical protein
MSLIRVCPLCKRALATETVRARRDGRLCYVTRLVQHTVPGGAGARCDGSWAHVVGAAP